MIFLSYLFIWKVIRDMENRLQDLYNNEKFNLYYEFLVSENEKYNLTNITLKEDVYIKHFLDSLSLENICDLNKDISMCDVGSGAGFPSVPLKIMYPNIKLTIIEPTLKRCNFLKQLFEKLGITDVEVINDRAENIKNMKFDIVTARAVSNLPMLLELCLPLTKVKGRFVALKGSNYKEELVNSNNALKVLNGKVFNVKEYTLLNDVEKYGIHSLIEIIKEKENSSIYPRSYSLIKKKPL